MKISEYAICHSRKFEIRCSPEVRITRSGSGICARVQRVRDVVLIQPLLQPIHLDQVFQRASALMRLRNQPVMIRRAASTISLRDP